MVIHIEVNDMKVSGTPTETAQFVNALTSKSVPTTTTNKATTKTKVRPMTGKAWTTEEQDVLLEIYGSMPAKEVAKRLGRNISAVYVRANQLGLKAKILR